VEGNQIVSSSREGNRKKKSEDPIEREALVFFLFA